MSESDIILCESRQTSTWSLVTREFIEPSWEEKQMNAGHCMCIRLRKRKKAVDEYCKVGATAKSEVVKAGCLNGNF